MAQKLRRLLPLLVSALVVAGVGLSLSDGSKASAAPAGAAQNIHVAQQWCAANGTVSANFAWSPSHRGTQWFDVSHKNDNFTSSYWPYGPYGASMNSIQLNGFQSNVTYYIRVTTWGGSSWLISDTFAFHPTACGGGGGGGSGGGATFSPPHTLRTNVSGDDVNFSWTRGSDNDWFCVDVARDLNDLFNFRGSFDNHGCGTTGTQLNVRDLGCGREFVWRLWAVGDTGRGHSNYASFQTAPCPVGEPHNLNSNVLGPNSARVSWSPGANNVWFCVDIATSVDHLVNFRGSFDNHGCGTTNTALTVHGLRCDTEYVWRVWGWGPNGGAHSEIRSFTTRDCGFTPPHNLETTVAEDRGVRFDWDAGRDNVWFCVDTAESERDLRNFRNTWQNHGCGTTNEFLGVEMDEFDCGELYYWRVFGVASYTSGHSEVETFRTPDC